MSIVHVFLALVLMIGSSKPEGKYSKSKYFENKEESKGTLDEIQGALYDIMLAWKDLKAMETNLQNIVDSSSYFFRAESAVEFAVDADPYGNAWKNGGDSSNANEGKIRLVISMKCA